MLTEGIPGCTEQTGRRKSAADNAMAERPKGLGQSGRRVAVEGWRAVGGDEGRWAEGGVAGPLEREVESREAESGERRACAGRAGHASCVQGGSFTTSFTAG